jgi:hypothetical protein
MPDRPAVPSLGADPAYVVSGRRLNEEHRAMMAAGVPQAIRLRWLRRMLARAEADR